MIKNLFAKTYKSLLGVEKVAFKKAMWLLKNPNTPKYVKLLIAEQFWDYLPIKPGFPLDKNTFIYALEINEGMLQEWSKNPYRSPSFDEAV